MNNTKFIIGGILVLTYMLIGIVSLPEYGVNWDESTHFGRGYAILHFFLTGEKDYKNESKNESTRRSFYQSDAYTFTFFEEKFSQNQPLTVGGHPPIGGFFAALFNSIFYQKLGILGDIESFHLYSIVISGVFIGFLFFFVTDVYGLFPALVTAISLITYPLFLGESRFNIKDVPEACFFGMTMICFYYAISKKRLRWVIATALFFGLGLATKLNILFALPIMFLWGIFAKNRKILLQSFFVVPLVGVAIFLGSWPMLWADPIKRLAEVYAYYKTIGTNIHFDSQFLTIFRLNTYAGQWILYTTPLVILFFCLFGIVGALKRISSEKYKVSLLVLFWFVTPIARVTLPHTNIYGGVRQIMEYIPPMAILAGIGAKYMLDKFKNYRFVVQIVIIGLFIPIIFKMISMHPNESVYFNTIIGGLKGAAARNIPGWGNSLGSTYRQGVKWLNEHAEKGAKLATGFGLRSNIALIDLRSDIRFENRFRSGPKHDGEYIIEVTHEGTQEGSYMRTYLDHFLTPVYELTVEGVPVLKIWENDFIHTKQEYQKEQYTLSVTSFKQNQHTLFIDIGKVVSLTKIDIRLPKSSSCIEPIEGYTQLANKPQDWSAITPWFYQIQEDGNYLFLFSANPARYIKMTVTDDNVCLLRGTIGVSVSYL